MGNSIQKVFDVYQCFDPIQIRPHAGVKNELPKTALFWGVDVKLGVNEALHITVRPRKMAGKGT